MKSNFFIFFAAVYLVTGCTRPISQEHNKVLPSKHISSSLDDRNILIKMAEEKFGRLTEADKILFTAVCEGNCADYSEGGNKDKPKNADKWGKNRNIYANRIEWLCHYKQAKEIITDNGILIKGAKLIGTINLDYAEIPFPLAFERCVFEDEIKMNSAQIKFLILSGSYVGLIQADGIKVDSGVFLRDGFKADGEISFIGANIGEDFDCANGEFINESGRTIIAERMDVKGTVFLKDGFKATNEISFMGANIGGDFDCTKGEFINKNGRSVTADRAKIKGSVFLHNSFVSKGEVHFVGAEIGGDLVCDNGTFINEDNRAISADGVTIKGSVFLTNDFKANGEIRFIGAAIGLDFCCTNGEFINKSGKAISADGIDIKGCVYLRNSFSANGEVRFSGAKIGGDFDCNNGKFINKGGRAISADGMSVNGAVFLRDGFKANGEVSFIGATIGKNLDCTNGKFIDEDGEAISADGMVVKDAVFFRNGFKAEGLVSLEGATVGDHFFWSDVNITEKTILDLRNAKTGVLQDDEKSWPVKGRLFLDGFVYESIGDHAPKKANSRVEWLSRQGYEWFRPGPYEQLAKVLDKMGHTEDAIKIRVEKENKTTELGGFGIWKKFWRGVLYWTIGYGYRPLWALWWMVVFIFIGLIFFKAGHYTGVIVQIEDKSYNNFNSLVYSIEKFVPVVNLDTAKYWIPDANKGWGGRVIRMYMWVHIIAGWILTTLLIVGLTGLVKK